MKKNSILIMLTIFSFIVACKKETIIMPENKPVTTPSIFGKWNWVKTVGTSNLGSYTLDPQEAGYSISLLLNSDSTFYKMKQTMSTTSSEILAEGKFRFFDLRAVGGGGSANSSTATSPDEIATRIQFNGGDSLPIGIYHNFDTIVIHNKAKTMEDTYVRTK